MLQNPIHLRLERLESWQHVTFYGLLVRAHVPELRHVLQADGIRRRTDLPSHSGSDLETLTVKDAKVNFDSQLEKFEEAIPAADDYDLYGVYPAIDACVALSELMHSRLSGETLEHAIEVSKTSITTVAMLEMTQAGREMTDEELKTNSAVEQEWDIQWEIFRLLADCEERDIELIKGLRADLREAGESNIGINFQQ
ncbi:putative cytoplasmic protein [Salmonella enterica subsp. arizonae]|uniref:Putative cytoplasmic protein n=1 Tax=Salmonella enterica subsp. arizonae TaxID=59203 RepID=A0A3S4IFB8_SALER|nr:putative cytoplasmic protein [Salmonella enterica subsp. arizonae]